MTNETRANYEACARAVCDECRKGFKPDRIDNHLSKGGGYFWLHYGSWNRCPAFAIWELIHADETAENSESK